MKCLECEFFKDNQCIKAQKLEISSIDNPVCLQRIQIMLLRDIFFLFHDESGENWKE